MSSLALPGKRIFSCFWSWWQRACNPVLSRSYGSFKIVQNWFKGRNFLFPYQAVTGYELPIGRGYKLEQETFLQLLRAVPSEGISHEPSATGWVPRPSREEWGKGQSSAQLPRRVVLKNVLNIGQLQSFPMLVRSCLKSCMLQLGRLQSMGLQRVRHDWMTKHSTWLQQYVNQELADIQTGFRKGSGIRDQIANIHWITEKAREFRKKSTFALLTIPEALTVWITTNCGKILRRWEYQTTWPASWEISMQVKKKQNWIWNNSLAPNQERSTSRLYTVTMLI